MSGNVAKPPVFDLSGGHPALNFVNSLDHRFGERGPVELVRNYADLLSFMEQTRLMDAARVRQLERSVNGGAGARALRAARELREALGATIYGKLNGRPPLARDLRILERHFLDADRHRELRWNSRARSDRRPRIAWNWCRFQNQAELPIWILAQAAAQLMMSDAMEQVRACGAPTCRWLFLDTSRNHTRRWCNMKVCGNRMKARRFQARHH